MVKAKRMMERNEHGAETQYFPITHPKAVIGLEKRLKETNILGTTMLDTIKTIIIDYENGDLGGSASGEGVTKQYVDLECEKALRDAKAYTDLKISELDLSGGGSGYTLPTASATVLGGVKVGSGLSINSSGVLSATGGGGTSGVSQKYVDDQDAATLGAAKAYTDAKKYTKSDVGLASVQDYGVATQVDATTGTASNKYMTPQRTKQAIDSNSQYIVFTGTQAQWNAISSTEKAKYLLVAITG